ncbi:MAG: hypothetical protein QXW38_08430 [Candidatus Nitrosotenuis sp.]
MENELDRIIKKYKLNEEQANRLRLYAAVRSQRELANATAQQPVRNPSLLQSLVPIATSTAGAIGGGLLGGPAGAVAGGASGGALGAALIGKTKPSELALEAGFGALAGPIGKVGRLALLRKGAKVAATEAAARAAARAAEDQAARGFAKLPALTLKATTNLPKPLVKRLKPNETANEMLQHLSFKHLTPNAQLAWTERAINFGDKLVREALAKAPNEVQASNALKAVGNVLSKSGLDIKTQQGIRRHVASMISEFTGKRPGTMSAIDAIQAVRNLEEEGYSRLFAAQRSFGRDAVTLAKEARGYLGAADELKLAIEQAVGKQTITNIKTPAVIAEAQSISKKFADQLLKAHNISDLRNISAVPTRWNQILRRSAEATEAGMGIGGRRLPSMVIGGLGGGAAAGPLGAMAGVLFSPTIEGVVEAARFPLLTAVALGEKLTGSLARKVAAGIRVASIKSGVQVAAKAPFGMGPLSSSGNEFPPTPPQNIEELANLEEQLRQDIRIGGETTNIESLREQFAAAMMADLATTGGKNVANLQRVFNFMVPQATAQMKNQLIAADAAEAALTELETAVNNIGLKAGPEARLSGAWRSFAGSIGFDSAVSYYNDVKRGFAIKFIRALGEVGALSEADIKAAISLIPKPTDKIDEAQLKLTTLRNMFNRVKKSVQNVNQQFSTVNETTGFPSSPTELNFNQGGF